MIQNKTITFATLNVQGINDEQKCQIILSHLSSNPKFDLILLQETNLRKQNIDYIKEKPLWEYESEWTSKTAILAGKKNIIFENFEEIEYGCRTSFKYNNWTFQVTNICVPSNLANRKDFLNKWTPSKRDDVVNIIVGNFNLVTLSPTRKKFNQTMSKFSNTEDMVGKSSFHYFYSDEHTNQTKRDYIFIDTDNAQFCRKTESHFNLFDQPLVECTLELSTWRLNEQLLEVSSIKKEIQQKLTSISKVTASEWNKIKINSILNKLLSDLDADLTHLNPEIREELIKDGWIKGNERSTLKIHDKYPEFEENQTNRILGFYVDKKGQNAKDLWQKKIKDIEEAIHKVDKINNSTNKNKLSSEGRKQIVRTFLSKIWHASYLQPPTEREIKTLSNIIAQWINDRCLSRNDLFNQLKDMLDARLGIIWIKLLSSDCLWAKEERKSIERILFQKISISAAINSQRINSDVWPSKWRPYFIAWKRLNGKVPLDGSWPWNQNLIEIAGIKADEYSVMFAVEYLEKIRKRSRLSKRPNCRNFN
ncbi:12332_t:CDS:2 [Dentiscutata heterogama]|uniref:12332_t:CDS:1 n=1 Tax=Dentiscutata heterogama TaxID=1316150 RepID=A0ACA9MI72_9GLOM|nr:12332_t:CDS:2 [Dentiscutata heterogama]